MIKYFRPIRQRLFSENNFSKPASPAGRYLLYAIGEIVLVVIGILIALSINNWNENKQSNIKFNKLLVNVFNDLEVDLEIAQNVVEFYKNKDTLANYIINDKLSVTDYKNNPNLNLFFGYRGFRITNMGYSALMRNTESIPNGYEQVIADLNRQYIVIAEAIESSLMVFAGTVENSRTRYALNFPWYSQSDSISNEKRWQHLAHNPIYKNEVQLYKTYGISNFSGNVKQFYLEGIPLYLTLKTIINESSSLPDFFPKNDEGFDSVKSDYIGKYMFQSQQEISILERNGFLFIRNNGRLILLSMLSKDKFLNHYNGNILSFKRDKSNKIVGWFNGTSSVKKLDVND